METIDLHGIKVLVADDEADMCYLLESALANVGAAVAVAMTGRDALESYRTSTPDVVILDVMMPGADGLTVCGEIMRQAYVPIILPTALDSEEDILRGLRCGAIDYVTKPFSLNVLLMRVQAAVMRGSITARQASLPRYDDGYLSIDLANRHVLVQGTPVKLTPIELRLLACLLEKANYTVPVEEILRRVWGTEYHDSPNYVHVYVSRLRTKLERHPGQPTYFWNERGTGYRFATK